MVYLSEVLAFLSGNLLLATACQSESSDHPFLK